MKQKCAEAALGLIKEHTVIGLGGGSTVAILASLIAKAGLSVGVVTPSAATASLCVESGLRLLPTWSVDSVDIAFDGCDELDASLNALKSGGGIHVCEKIVASMADEYVLLADESKVSATLPFSHPLVLEVFPEARSFVERRMQELGGAPVYRTSGAKDGLTVSDHGNYLLDVRIGPPKDLAALHDTLLRIPGVAGSSLFYRVAARALVAGPEGVRQMTGK